MKAINNNVFVEPIFDDVTESGIAIMGTAVPSPTKGKVLSSDVEGVKEGDVLCFNKNAPTYLKGREILVLKKEDCLCVITDA